MVKVYPNPSKGQFKVELLNFTKGTANISIVYGKGEIVKKSQVNVADNHTIDFDLAGKAAGMYFITINQMSGTKTYKVLIQQ